MSRNVLRYITCWRWKRGNNLLRSGERRNTTILLLNQWLYFLASSALCCKLWVCPSHLFFPASLHSFFFSFHLPLFLLHVSKGTPFTRVLLTSSRIPAMGTKTPLFRSKFVSPVGSVHLHVLCLCAESQVTPRPKWKVWCLHVMKLAWLPTGGKWLLLKLVWCVGCLPWCYWENFHVNNMLVVTN